MLSGLVWLLALAVSIDGFSAGLSCGLRKLIIPFPSLMVICGSSAAAVAVSMLVGEGIASLISVEYVTVFGGSMLAVLGLYVILQNIKESHSARQVEKPPESSRRRRRLAQLVSRPEEADLDHSGVLSMKEALLLGSALAADAFAAGFGAALSGVPLIYTVFAVGLAKLILVPLGVISGRRIAQAFPIKYPGVISGIILMGIGIFIII